MPLPEFEHIKTVEKEEDIEFLSVADTLQKANQIDFVDIGFSNISIGSRIAGRPVGSIVGAFNNQGQMIGDIINERLDTASKKILSDFDFGTTDYAGALKSGTITWNTTTGAVTGGSGVAIFRGGIVGTKDGDITFSLDSDTGDAVFSGDVIGANIQGATITGGLLRTAHQFKVIETLNATSPSDINDEYYRDGSQGNRPAYTNGTYWIWYDTSDKYWKISSEKGGGTVYFRTTFDERPTPITTQWEVVNGVGSNFSTGRTAEDSQQTTINEGGDGEIRLYNDLMVLRGELKHNSFYLRDVTESFAGSIGWSETRLSINSNSNIQFQVGGSNREMIYGFDSSSITIAQGAFRPGVSAQSPNLGDDESVAHRWGQLYARYSTDVSSSIVNKEEIEDIHYGLKDILKLKPVEFKTKERKRDVRGTGKEVGFIKEDVEKVIPEITSDTGYTPAELIPILVKAVQELHNELQELKNNV